MGMGGYGGSNGRWKDVKGVRLQRGDKTILVAKGGDGGAWLLAWDMVVMEIPSFNEPEPQPQPFLSYPSLEVDLGEERDPEPPIKPPSPDSFRMKEVDHLTIHTPPLPHIAYFQPKDKYCYYHPCIDDPKKHYGFKPGRGLSSSVRPKEVKNVRIKETHHSEHIIQQPIFQHVTPSHHNGVYQSYHPHLNSTVEEPSPLSVK
ncbi:hypothetical protein Tco_0167807 [Tanacetum coccineum]